MLWVCLFAGPLCPVPPVRKQILQFPAQRRDQAQQHSRDLQSPHLLFLVMSLPCVQSLGVLSGCLHSFIENICMCTHMCSLVLPGVASFGGMLLLLARAVPCIKNKSSDSLSSSFFTELCLFVPAVAWKVSDVSGNYWGNMVFPCLASLLPFQPCSCRMVLPITFWALSHRQAENISTTLT